MMAATLNLAILDSDTLFSSLRFTQKHSHSTLTLAQSNSIWLKLIHSDSTWWWQPSWILPCWIQTLPSWIQTPSYPSLRLTPKHSHSTLTLTQKNSIWLTWWWLASWILPSWILPSWIQPFCTKLWLKLIQSDSNSFILTQLDDGSHLEFCHLEFGNLGFSHLSFSSQTHPHLPRLVPTICTKKNLHSFFLTQLDDGSHLEFYHIGFRQCHLGFRHLVFFSQIHSKTLSLHSDSWLKLIQSDSNSFILTQLDDGSHL